VYPGGTIYASGTERLAINHCNFTSVGGNGVVLHRYNRDAALSNSEFSWVGDSAVVLLGATDGIDGTAADVPVGTVISGNVMHELGVYVKQAGGVYAALASRTTIYRNLIFSGPRAAVNINDGYGGGHAITGNLMFNCVRETSDHGWCASRSGGGCVRAGNGVAAVARRRLRGPRVTLDRTAQKSSLSLPLRAAATPFFPCAYGAASTPGTGSHTSRGPTATPRTRGCCCRTPASSSATCCSATSGPCGAWTTTTAPTPGRRRATCSWAPGTRWAMGGVPPLPSSAAVTFLEGTLSAGRATLLIRRPPVQINYLGFAKNSTENLFVYPDGAIGPVSAAASLRRHRQKATTVHAAGDHADYPPVGRAPASSWARKYGAAPSPHALDAGISAYPYCVTTNGNERLSPEWRDYWTNK
jgi:hypothetical protein